MTNLGTNDHRSAEIARRHEFVPYNRSVIVVLRAVLGSLINLVLAPDQHQLQKYLIVEVVKILKKRG